jgi:hypothetical protein
VDTFIESFRKDLSDQQPNTYKQRYNLTKGERKAIESLSSRDDIIITLADKGGAVVIIDVENYLEEANRQLNNQNFYAQLTHDPTGDHADIINETIKSFVKEKLLSDKLGKLLKQTSPKTPNMYFRPKVHKTDIPGRPIVSSINSHSSKISHFVDIHLQPIISEIKSHIKDTTDFINRIEKIKTIPENTILVTMDVKSLFTNIPHTEGINAVATALEKMNDNTVSTRVLIKFLSLVLHLNNFEFNGHNFLQKKGASMGSKSSCSYADIFMDAFESKHIYPRIRNQNLCYYRFVDDLFMIWTGSEENLLKFFKEINNVHESIKFDCKYSFHSINFLDTTVFKNNTKSLSTRLFTKPTDRPAYLHSNSYHPKSLIKNIPYGQALRAKRICTEEKDLKQALDTLKANFQKRGYKEQLINEQFSRISQKQRTELLTYKEDPGTNKIKFMTTYNRNLPNIKTTIDKNWDILQTNERLANIFKDKPILTFKRNKNLRDLIGGTKMQNNKRLTKRENKSGFCGPCLSQVGNICCKQIISTKFFRSSKTGKQFEIRHKVNCKTRKGIYLGSCILCPIYKYVGKFETPWNKRLYTHRADAKKETSIPFDEHFSKPGHNFTDHARFIIIEKLTRPIDTETDRKTLQDREDFWMAKLNTHTPHGFNVQYNSNIRNKIHHICT